MTTPRMRAGDAERQQAADRLAEHYTAGRLSTQEYDERVANAYKVTYLDEMSGLFDDLPGSPGSRTGFSDAFGGPPFGAPPFGSQSVSSPFDANPFGRGSFGPAFAKARAAGARNGRGPGGFLPRLLAIALMVLVGIAAVVVLVHLLVPLFVIGLIAFLVSRHRHGGGRGTGWGGPGPRGGWGGSGPWGGWGGPRRRSGRAHDESDHGQRWAA